MTATLRRAALAAATAAVVGSCASSTTLPDSPPVLDVTMREYSFALDGSVPEGRVVVRAHNAGTFEHELVLVVLPADYPERTLDQLRSTKRRALATRAYLPRRAGGASRTFAVELTEGRYAFMCFVPAPDGEPHALKGMTLQFKVD